MDILNKILIDCDSFRENLKLLRVEGTIHEESFYPLEVLSIHCEEMKLRTSQIRQKLKLKNLKRIDVRGCIVKDDLYNLEKSDENQTSHAEVMA